MAKKKVPISEIIEDAKKTQVHQEQTDMVRLAGDIAMRLSASEAQSGDKPPFNSNLDVKVSFDTMTKEPAIVDSDAHAELARDRIISRIDVVIGGKQPVAELNTDKPTSKRLNNPKKQAIPVLPDIQGSAEK